MFGLRLNNKLLCFHIILIFELNSNALSLWSRNFGIHLKFLIFVHDYFILFAIRAMQSSHDNGANKESVIVLSCSLHHRLHSQMAPSCVVDCCIVWQPNVTSLHTLNTGTPSSHHLPLVWLIVAYLPTPKPPPTPPFGYPASAVSPSAHPLPQNKQIV